MKRKGTDFYKDQRSEAASVRELLNQFNLAPRVQECAATQTRTFFTQADIRSAYRRYSDAKRRKAEGRKPLQPVPIC